MNDHSNLTLDDVLAFNQTLLKLERAGVPIGVGDSDSTITLQTKIDAINSKIAMAIARGNSVRQILESNEVLSSQYRSALSTWLFCNYSPEALSALSDQAGQRRDMEHVLSFSLVQPIIIAGLVYLGFLYLVFGVSPKLESIALQIGAEPGFGLQFLQMAKNTAWIWAIAFPLFVVGAVAAWNQNRSRLSLKCIPGRKRIAVAVENANKAEGIRTLFENDVSRDPLIQPTDAAGLLNWSLGDGMSPQEKIGALSATANTYRGIASTRSKQMRSWFPTLVGASLGGVFVLIFGLSLFEPMIELLTALTRP